MNPVSLMDGNLKSKLHTTSLKRAGQLLQYLTLMRRKILIIHGKVESDDRNPVGNVIGFWNVFEHLYCDLRTLVVRQLGHLIYECPKK